MTFSKQKDVSFDEFEQIVIEAGEGKYRCYQRAMQGKGRDSKDDFVLLVDETLRPLRKYLAK